MAATSDELVLVHAARSYLVGLLAFIGFVTLFEGYDLLLINLAPPALGREIGVDAAVLSKAVGLINVGTIVAFIVQGRVAVKGAGSGQHALQQATKCFHPQPV